MSSMTECLLYVTLENPAYTEPFEEGCLFCYAKDGIITMTVSFGTDDTPCRCVTAEQRAERYYLRFLVFGVSEVDYLIIQVNILIHNITHRSGTATVIQEQIYDYPIAVFRETALSHIRLL